ncbi:MAG: hypothetical protein M1818_000537 [Claussenomyces sp. TS43310]|nr:MAG: hypothetical protein M1818_000537 [Claussenomyces sp. TS43310]
MFTQCKQASTPAQLFCTPPNVHPTIDPSLRLRRAIHTADLSLTTRILRSHPRLLRNPDFCPAGHSNTSLHLAASLGLIAIVNALLTLGHEAEGISLNEEHQTPLILAAREGHTDVVLALCQSGLGSVARQDARGRDAVMEASCGGHDTCLQILLTYAPAARKSASNNPGPGSYFGSQTTTHLGDSGFPRNDEGISPSEDNARALLAQADQDGNTALHFASSNGHLLVLRTLLAAGADASRRNLWSWTPVSYSATVAAEVYFKGLVADTEKRKIVRKEVLAKKKGGGLRLVSGGGQQQQQLGSF